MNKLYTNSLERIATCHEFEEKFKSYLAFLKANDLGLYCSLISQKDFKIMYYDKFKEDFHSFFENWIQDTFSNKFLLNMANLEVLINELSKTDSIYDEVFSYHNLYKRINDEAHEKLYILDITLSRRQKEIVKKLNDKQEVSFSSLQKEFDSADLHWLKEKKFIEIDNGIAKPTFKARHAI